MPLDLELYNENIRAWGVRFRGLAKSKGTGMGITHRSNSPSPSASLPLLKDKYRLSHGSINKISFVFRRTLFYTITGSGKGIGGNKGSRWLNAKGETKKTARASLGKIGKGSRKQKNFVIETLDGVNGIEELADIAAESLGDAIVSKILTS